MPAIENGFLSERHLDSTHAVIDADGNVTESSDYYPFGLQMPGRGFLQGSIATKEGFTGKEQDGETSWQYFGARYYHPGLGKWLAVDPLKAKYPSLSPYNYVANNPLNMFDPDGQFHVLAHNAIIRHAFSGIASYSVGDRILTNEEISTLQQASKDADGKEYQDVKYSYRHAMRAPGQSVEEARKLYNDFIKEQQDKFIMESDPDKALYELGLAMHAIMDAFSPEHKGFQLWKGFTWKNGWGILHGIKESIYTMNLDASRAIRLFYLESVKKKTEVEKERKKIPKTMILHPVAAVQVNMTQALDFFYIKREC